MGKIFILSIRKKVLIMGNLEVHLYYKGYKLYIKFIFTVYEAKIAEKESIKTKK